MQSEPYSSTSYLDYPVLNVKERILCLPNIPQSLRNRHVLFCWIGLHHVPLFKKVQENYPE